MSPVSTVTESLPRFEADILAFEAQDRLNPPPQGGVVFVGSSSVRMWNDLKEDFAPIPVLNRGFGGSFLTESVHYAERIVTKYRPRAVVVYAGENDLGNGFSAEHVFTAFKSLVAKVQAECPKTDIFFVSVKPSPGRGPALPEIARTNELVEVWIQAQPRVHYIDVATPMMGPDRIGRKEFFVEDGVHMKRNGYELWTAVIKPYLTPLF